MSNRWAPGPWARWLIGAAAVVLLLIIVWALLVPGADWLARHDVGSAKGSLATARDAARPTAHPVRRAARDGRAAVHRADSTLSRRTFELTEQGQVTDRYTKAIEQLGSDKLDVRIGGIYALERVARDSAKDHPTVMEVLTAFIREHSREPWPPPDPGVQVGARSTRPDVQAAITVVGRRGRKHDIQPMDLGGANLGGANLGGTSLGAATLTRAYLGGADLSHAYLATAHLDGATLAGANLGGAYLGYADLTDADLTGATLGYATLTGAKLDGADLTRADLTYANLTTAHLDGATLRSATLTGAKLDGATLRSATLTGAKLGGADLTRANLGGADLTRANLGGTDLTRANLGGTELITDANLTGANLDGANLGGVNLTDARWPEDVPVPGGWKLNTDSGRLEKTATGAGPTETN